MFLKDGCSIFLSTDAKCGIESVASPTRGETGQGRILSSTWARNQHKAQHWLHAPQRPLILPNILLISRWAWLTYLKQIRLSRINANQQLIPPWHTAKCHRNPSNHREIVKMFWVLWQTPGHPSWRAHIALLSEFSGLPTSSHDSAQGSSALNCLEKEQEASETLSVKWSDRTLAIGLQTSEYHRDKPIS